MPRPKPPRFSDPPTDDELFEALTIARNILADPEDDWYPASQFKLDEEFALLGLETAESQRDAITRAAAEVCPTDYLAPEPPGIAQQTSCKGTQMLPFHWNSTSFQKLMFFKFGIQRHGFLYVFSLHVPNFSNARRTR